MIIPVGVDGYVGKRRSYH